MVKRQAESAPKMGRPPKDASERRSEPVTVYLTKNERAELQRTAEAEGTPLSSLIMRPWRQEQ
jgi:hypothetical protein